MARPLNGTLASQLAAWDATIAGNFTKLFNQPLPIHESASLTESNLAATFPAASYDRCLVWVNHSVFSYTLYRSNGASWEPFDPRKQVTRAVTNTATLSFVDEVVLVSGTLPYTVTLDTAVACRGRTLLVKTLVAGILTLDGSGSETIDGALTQTILTQYGALRLYSDGTAWHILSRFLT